MDETTSFNEFTDTRKTRSPANNHSRNLTTESSDQRSSREKPRHTMLTRAQTEREDSSAHLVSSSSSSEEHESSCRSNSHTSSVGVIYRRKASTTGARDIGAATDAVAPGKFRYLKPDEIQSGTVPNYDFAVIVNRKVHLSGCSRRSINCICGCPHAHDLSVRTPVDSMTKGLQARYGFRRLCLTASPILQASEDEHRRIVNKLCTQGLFVDIIDGGDSKGEMHSGYLILLIRAPDAVVLSLVEHFRTQMWMEYGAVVDMEHDVVQRRHEPLTPAERIEIVDFIIEQRARLSKRDVWIHDLFPLHNRSVTKTLIHRWVASWRLHELDDQKVLRSLRYNFGEKVAYYFAFLKYYNTWLIPLAAMGILLELVRGVITMTTYMRLLPIWGLGVSVFWGFGFLKSWERENACMQFDWTGKLHVKQIAYRSKQFHGLSRVNAQAGDVAVVSAAWRRPCKYFCVFLFMVLQMLIMLVLVASWVTIYEILKATFKQGHIFSTQWWLILLQGCVFGFFVDVVQWNMVVTKMGALFTQWENYQTEEQYETALIRKLFLLDFLNYYTWFFSLAFVFVIPGLGNYVTNSLNHMVFGDALNCCFGPYVDPDGTCTACPVGKPDAPCIECQGFFAFDRHHVDLGAMFVTPIVITQSLNILLRLVAPMLVRKRRETAQARADADAQERVRDAGSLKILGALDYADEKPSQFANKSSSRYLEYSRSEIEVLNKKAREILFDSAQDTFDPYDDFHVLTVQFGFTVMFSMLWPLMPFACLLINSIKGRTDGYRLCKTLKRPIPRRANGIGAWQGILTTFAYIAVIVNVLLICISTGVLEFFNDVCVREIEQELAKEGKRLEEFIFGPNFGCLHIAWRLLFILLLEHFFVAVAYVGMARVARVPRWIQAVMSARETNFKALLRQHELTLFPQGRPEDRTPVARGCEPTAGLAETGGRMDTKRGSGHLSSVSTQSLRPFPAQVAAPTIATIVASHSILIDPMTPLTRSPEDLAFPSSTGHRTKAREMLARQWSDGSEH